MYFNCDYIYSWMNYKVHYNKYKYCIQNTSSSKLLPKVLYGERYNILMKDEHS